MKLYNLLELKDTADDKTSTQAAEDDAYWHHPLAVMWRRVVVRKPRLHPEINQTQEEGHERPKQMNPHQNGLLIMQKQAQHNLQAISISL